MTTHVLHPRLLRDVGPWPALGPWSSGFAALISEAGHTFLSTTAARSYGGGLLRFGADIVAPALIAWPHAGRLLPFAYDWMGRVYGLDTARTVNGLAFVSRVEPDIGEILESDIPFDEFVADQFGADAEATLAIEFFDEWQTAGGRPLDIRECAGFRIPLFLGGTEDVANLEIVDADVYLTIAGQLAGQTLGMEPGTHIDRVSER